jgi:hypothetical protein
MDKRIIEFIKKHHVLTLSTAINNYSYSCNCFYAYDEVDNVLICTSDENTRHVKNIETNNNISGTIVLETMQIGKIQGLQFLGKIFMAKDDLLKKYKKIYIKKFPFAILKNTDLWYIELEFCKYTDNRLGFGKKLIWHKEIKE